MSEAHSKLGQGVDSCERRTVTLRPKLAGFRIAEAALLRGNAGIQKRYCEATPGYRSATDR